MDDGHEALSLAMDTAATAGSELALEKIVVKPALATMARRNTIQGSTNSRRRGADTAR
jgi:hypothetical protein